MKNEIDEKYEENVSKLKTYFDTEVRENAQNPITYDEMENRRG